MATKRMDLSLDQKVALLDQFKTLDKMSKREAATTLGISRGLLHNLLKNEEGIRASSVQRGGRKRRRVGKDEAVESALLEWFELSQQRNMRVNGPLLCQIAESLAQMSGHNNFRATAGWFSRWKKRNGVVFKASKREDIEAALDFSLPQLPVLLHSFDKRNIITVEEATILFRALPNSMALEQGSERLNLLVCCAMDGGKEDLLAIGTSPSPSCFQNISNLPLTYEYSPNGRLTSAIWERWLRALDVKMQLQQRKVLLLVKMSPEFAPFEGLQHVVFQFLPPDCPTVLQTIEKGVIWALRAFYRQHLSRNIIDAMEDSHEVLSAGDAVRKMSLVDALSSLDVSWWKVPPGTIRTCWLRANLPLETTETPLEPECSPVPPPSLSQDAFERWSSLENELGEAGPSDSCMDLKEEEMEEESAPAPTAADLRAALATLEKGLRQSHFPHSRELCVMGEAIKEHLHKLFPAKEEVIERLTKP